MRVGNNLFRRRFEFRFLDGVDLFWMDVEDFGTVSNVKSLGVCEFEFDIGTVCKVYQWRFECCKVGCGT